MHFHQNSLPIRRFRPRRSPVGIVAQSLRTAILSAFLWFSLLSTFGCQAIQNRISKKAEKCGALCEQARKARERGNAVQANRFLDEALRQHPSDTETRRELAETMWNGGRHTEALQMLETLYSQQPSDMKVATRYAVALWDDKQPEKAATVANAILQIDHQSSEAWRIKARNEVLEGRPDDALVSYLQLSQLEPTDYSTLKELSELYLKQGRPERACSLLLEASQDGKLESGNRSEIDWLLGISYARNERWCEAVATLERSIGQRPSTAEDWCLLGWTKLKSGDYVGAKADLRKAYENNPDSIAVRRFASQLEGLTDVEPSHSVITRVAHSDTP